MIYPDALSFFIAQNVFFILKECLGRVGHASKCSAPGRYGYGTGSRLTDDTPPGLFFTSDERVTGYFPGMFNL
jgi:hypothetical protein